MRGVALARPGPVAPLISLCDGPFSMAETCSACGAPASGRFCNQCGAALEAACRECGNPLPRGARFCNQCGTAVAPAAAASARPSPVPWIVAGVLAAALAGVLLFRRGGGEEPTAAQPPFAAAPAAGAGGPAGNPGAVDLASMSPREAADRLFNRVMTAVSSGDSAQARQFLPMAIAAYSRVDSLDADGRYHLAALHLVAGDNAGARTEAGRILAGNPSHLFGLFTAAQAEAALGNRAQSVALYRRFLDAYESEAGKPLTEYQDHAQALPAMREEARRATSAGQ